MRCFSGLPWCGSCSCKVAAFLFRRQDGFGALDNALPLHVLRIYIFADNGCFQVFGLLLELLFTKYVCIGYSVAFSEGFLESFRFTFSSFRVTETHYNDGSLSISFTAYLQDQDYLYIHRCNDNIPFEVGTIQKRQSCADLGFTKQKMGGEGS